MSIQRVSRLSATCLLAACLSQATAQVLPQGTHVYLFKNGYSFTSYVDTVPSAGGRSSYIVPGNAFYGTVWIGSPGGQIASIQSTKVEVHTGSPHSNMRELLLSNTGKRVTLILAYQEPIEATVHQVFGTYAVFRSYDRWITTDMSKIETIEFLEEPEMTTYDSAYALQITWKTQVPSQPLQVMYLNRKTAWLPSYRVELDGQPQAKVVMRADVINEGSELRNANLHMVVGVPKFAHAGVPDPMTNEIDLESFLDQIFGGGQRPQYRMGAYMNVAMAEADMATGQEATPTQNENFYIYTLGNVNLGAHSKASFNLIEAQVPVATRYKAVLPPAVPHFVQPFPGRGQPAPADQQPIPVMRSIQLQNTAEHPFSAAPVLVMDRNLPGAGIPLAQAAMPYTPKTAKSDIELTSVPDVTVKSTESEESRQSDQRMRDGRMYDEITVRAQVEVVNYKNQPFAVVLERTIAGEPLKSDADWVVEKQVTSTGGINPQTLVTWTVELAAGERRMITYTYKMRVWK